MPALQALDERGHVGRVDLDFLGTAGQRPQRRRDLHLDGHVVSCQMMSNGSSANACSRSWNTQAVASVRTPSATPTTTWITPSERPSAATLRSVSDGRAGWSGWLW